MPDSLRQLGREIGTVNRQLQLMTRRGGLLPQLERTRGNMIFKTSPMIATFTVKHEIRKVHLNLTFFKASIV